MSHFLGEIWSASSTLKENELVVSYFYKTVISQCSPCLWELQRTQAPPQPMLQSLGNWPAAGFQQALWNKLLIENHRSIFNCFLLSHFLPTFLCFLDTQIKRALHYEILPTVVEAGNLIMSIAPNRAYFVVHQNHLGTCWVKETWLA